MSWFDTTETRLQSKFNLLRPSQTLGWFFLYCLQPEHEHTPTLSTYDIIELLNNQALGNNGRPDIMIAHEKK